MTDATAPHPMPEPQSIEVADVHAALRAGWEDFKAAPGFGLVFGGLVTIIGLIIYAQLVVWNSGYWVIPIMAGFPLIGPFAAVGLYEVSRRREAGEPVTWPGVMQTIARERGRQIPSMAFVVLFFFFVWVYLAHLIFLLTFGLSSGVPLSFAMLLTGNGLLLLLVGTLVGGVLALLLFAVTVVSVPMLLDREIDVVTAMIASVQTVQENRKPMLTWALIVAGLTALAMIPFFLGMLVAFPVLGHASWHIYRKAIAPVAA